MKILKVKEYIGRSVYVKIGKTHSFKNGINEINFNLPEDLGETDVNKINIVSDRDIYYDNKLLFSKGGMIPFFSQVQLEYKRNYGSVVVDLRPKNSFTVTTDETLLTPEFILTMNLS